MKVTVLQYYKGFRSLYGFLAGIQFVPPLIRIFAPDTSGFAYLYPPLGYIQTLGLAFTFFVLFAVTIALFLYCQSRGVHRSLCVVLIGGGILTFCVLIGMYQFFVLHVRIPSVDQKVLVSVGCERTDFALRTYPSWSDEDMLHDRGPWEDSVRLLWTRRSLFAVRTALWAVYTLALGCFLAVFCVGAYQHASDVAAGSKVLKNQGK